MTFCQIIMLGNIGGDAQLSYTASGRAVCSFSLAVNRQWTDRNSNEKQKETTWFRIALWGQRAESLHQYLTKGTQVVVIGDRIQARAFAGNDGQPRASLEVTASDIRFVGGGRSEGGGAPQYSDADYPYSGGAGGGNDYGGTPDVDDIPF